MKKFIFIYIFCFFSFSFIANADVLEVPFSCWPKDLEIFFYKNGMKLDLSSDVRTSDSWGYIVNEGSSYKIITYRSIQKEDFEIIQKIVSTIELSRRNINE